MHTIRDASDIQRANVVKESADSRHVQNNSVYIC